MGPRAENQAESAPGLPVYTLPLGLPPSGLTMSLPGHLLPALVLLLGESSGLVPEAAMSGGSGAGPTEKEGCRPWTACGGGRRRALGILGMAPPGKRAALPGLSLHLGSKLRGP